MDTSLFLYKGHVTHIIDPSSFWIRMGTDADFQNFEEYQKTLDKFYNETGRKNSVSVDTLALGDCVMVVDTGQGKATDGENNTDFHWNRAKVSRVEGENVDVFYIDLGYTEIVNMSIVKTIDPELFDYIPPQVIQLGIAGIKPLSRSWTSRAIAMFESKVLNKEVLVSLTGYDEVNMFGQVLIYLRNTECTWHSLTHEMLEEDLGLPIDPKPEEFLSQEVVLAALANAEQEHALENDGEEDDGTKDDVNEAGGLNEAGDQKQNMSMPDILPSNRLLSPADFMLPPQSDSLSKAYDSSAVGVPAFDLNSLKPTRFLSLSKMQDDKNEEHRQQMRVRLEQEVQDCEDDEQLNGPEIKWAKTDLQIGEVAAFADFDNCIRQEIYKHNPHQSEQDDLHEFFHDTKRSYRDKPSTETSVIPEQIQEPQREKTILKPLTEIEDYKIQKKIEEILLDKDGRDSELVCVLVNSVIEPDIDVPCDRLVAIFMAVLESMMRNSNVDPHTAISVLETYLETVAFEEAIESVLKSLRNSFIKLPQSTRSPSYHLVFAEVLAALFVQAEHWPSSACSVIQVFVMSSLEHWTIFNKQRMQNRESCVSLEHLYLECVETLTDRAWESLNKRFPERCQSLLEEIKHKLLHDSTSRIIRIQLLNILLKLQANIPLTNQTRPSRRDVAVQTEEKIGLSSIVEGQDSAKGQNTSDRAINKPLYYPHGDGYTPDHDDVHLTTEINFHGSLLSKHAHDMYSKPSSVSFTQLDGTATSGANYGDQMGGHKKLLPKVFNKRPTHLQKKFIRDSGFLDENSSGEGKSVEIKDIQQLRSSGLNIHAPEFNLGSCSWSTVEHENETLCLSGESELGLLTNTGLKFRDSSKDIDNDALKSVHSNEELVVEMENSLDEEDSCPVGICTGGSVEQVNDASDNSDEMSLSLCSSDTESEESLSEQKLEDTSVDALKTARNDNRKEKIKYTSQELRALNMDSSACLATIDSLPEICKKDFVTLNAEYKSDHEAANLVRLSPPIPLHRYSGNGESPLDISGLKSNSANWKSLSELLPVRCFKTDYANFGTSVDPNSLDCEVSDDGPDTSVRAKPVSLKDIAKDLISAVNQPQPKHNILSCDESNTISSELLNKSISAGGEIVNSCDWNISTMDKDVDYAQKPDTAKWPEGFFKSVQRIPEKNINSASVGGHHVHLNTAIGPKSKKKKLKYRPISEVLLGKSSIHDDSYQEDIQSGLNLDDLQIQDQDVGGQVIHQPRLGSLSVGSSKRSFLLSSLRQDRSEGEPWVPGRRKCTWCGSEDHTIYDCPKEDPLRKLNDQSYYF